jgi:RNA recognition motif-containing protein
MQIYIGNLSPEISSQDLLKFFKGYGEYLSFEFKYYMRGNKRFYFAVTSIEPDIKAKKAIKRRNLKRVQGRVVVVRAYQDRLVANERRALNWREKIWTAEERRKEERRTLQHSKNLKEKVETYEPTPVRHHFW